MDEQLIENRAEELIGNGGLRSRSNPGKTWQVSYKFLLSPSLHLTSGPERVGVHVNSVGIVSATNGDELYAGFYDLECDNGETFKVQHFGLGRWAIDFRR